MCPCTAVHQSQRSVPWFPTAHLVLLLRPVNGTYLIFLFLTACKIWVVASTVARVEVTWPDSAIVPDYHTSSAVSMGYNRTLHTTANKAASPYKPQESSQVPMELIERVSFDEALLILFHSTLVFRYSVGCERRHISTIQFGAA